MKTLTALIYDYLISNNSLLVPDNFATIYIVSSNKEEVAMGGVGEDWTSTRVELAVVERKYNLRIFRHNSDHENTHCFNL